MSLPFNKIGRFIRLKRRQGGRIDFNAIVLYVQGFTPD